MKNDATPKYIYNLFKLLKKYNTPLTDLEYYFEDNKLIFAVNTNNMFVWGIKSCEILTENDLPLLEECLKITRTNGLLLFAAKKIGMRPQCAFYSLLRIEDWKFFDECGPIRDIGPQLSIN